MENIADAMSQGEKRRNNSDDTTFATETETRTTQCILSATTEPPDEASLTVISDHTSVLADATVRLRKFTFSK